MLTPLQNHQMHIVYAYLTHDDLWDQISEDGVSKLHFVPMYGSHVIWLAYMNKYGSIDGIVCVQIENATFCRFHIFMHKKSRQYKYEMLDEFKKYAYKNLLMKKIIAEIPEFLTPVIKTAEKTGMDVEGVNKKSYLKDGKLHDQIVFSMELEKWAV